MLNHRALAGLSLLLALTGIGAQGVPKSPDQARLRAHVVALTADSLQGRGAGHRGDSLAAAYLAAHFRRLGLAPMGDVTRGEPGFLQRFALHPRRPAAPLDVRASQNVIALLEGSDPALRDEYVVVGAHYDGQGAAGEADPGRRITANGGQIWPSANDNAAAVAAMLEIAEVLSSQAVRPKRSVLFIAFGAEEHGLVGSLHYAANPVVPWNRHVAMINLEMIGWDPDSTLNVRATATSIDWLGMLDSATALTGLPVTRRTPGLTNDTDHYGFGVNGIPVIHYGVGGSREHYHTQGDVADRIAFGALESRTRHILAMTQLVADWRRRVVYSWKHPRDAGITGTGLMLSELQALGLDSTRGALKVNAVAGGLPAHAAGLRGGDVITAVGGVTLSRRDNPLQVIRRAVDELPAEGGAVALGITRRMTASTITMQFRDTTRFDSTYVVMLGTGTPNPDPERSGPAMAVVHGDRSYLVDAGPGVFRRAAAAATRGVAALRAPNLRTLFLTHLHSDHTVGLPDLILSAWTLERTEPLDVYGPPGTRAMVEHLMAAYAADIRNRIDGLEPANTTGYRVNVHEVSDGFVYRDGDLIVRAFAVPHGDWEHAFGYRFETTDRSIVISGDTRASEAVVRACNGCDVLMHEVYSAERFKAREPEWQRYHANAHTSTVELADLATRARPRLLVLYHQLYWGTDDAGLLAEMRAAGYQGTVLSARDLQTYRE